VQVGGLVFDGSAEQIVNASCHKSVNPAKNAASVQLLSDGSIRGRGGQGRLARLVAR